MDTLHEDQHIFFSISRSILLRMRNVLEKCYRENLHIFCSITSFPENHTVYEIVRENTYFRAGQPTDYSMVPAHCLLDIQDYKHTLRIYNTYCTYAATNASRTRLSVSLYVNCPSFSSYLSFRRFILLAQQLFKPNTSARLPLHVSLTLNLLTTTIVAPPNNASKWQMGFNL